MPPSLTPTLADLINLFLDDNIETLGVGWSVRQAFPGNVLVYNVGVRDGVMVIGDDRMTYRESQNPNYSTFKDQIILAADPDFFDKLKEVMKIIMCRARSEEMRQRGMDAWHTKGS